MKGQVMETLGFVILAVTIIGVILFIRTYLSGNYGKTFLTLAERQQSEGLKAGLNSILETTEEKSGKKMMELLGIASYSEKTEISFGELIGNVNVSKELEWRMNNIYGEGKWYMKIPTPDIPMQIEMVIIIDTSSSLCDDVSNMKTNLPKMVDELHEKYDISVYIYLLPGGNPNSGVCCDNKGGGFKLDCSSLFQEKSYFHCRDMNQFDCVKDYRPKNEEDWGRGLACVADLGPEGNAWSDFSTKVGIVLSDELSGGNENPAASNQESLNKGIDAAKKIDMMVFPLKAETGKNVCPNCRNCGWSYCLGCPNMCYGCSGCPPNICVFSGGKQCNMFTGIQCERDEELSDFMNQIATETSGKVYELNNSKEATTSIENIIKEIILRPKPILEFGTKPPENKNLNTKTMSIPVVYIGVYTNIYFYQWV